MLIADMHNDYLTCCPEPFAYSETLNPDTFVTAAIWTTGNCTCGADVLRLAKSPAVSCGTFVSVEDCGCIAPSEWDLFSEAGVVMAGLTWNGANRYAGGAYSDQGLTEEGERLCRYLDYSGIFVDLAHLNHRSCRQVLDLGVRVVDSHTALDSCRSHPRNRTDDEVREILARGGRVGLTLVRDFFEGNTDAWAEQADTFIQKFGEKGLCIGTDFWGSDDFVSSEFSNRYENLSVLVEKLRKMGYNDSVVQNVFACNYLSLWSDQPCMSFMTTH